MRIRPPVLALALVALATLLSLVGFDARWLAGPWRWAGAALILPAVALALWALGRFRVRGTPHHPFRSPTALVTDGPYRWSRNPMYLAVTGALTGLAVLVGTAPFLLPPALFAAVMHVAQVPHEERVLEAAFGPAWRAWSARVRRWL